ncbi:MAG: hypothetical protein SXU28_00705 [Pseudomonadota bacterium]|nr:hypothetical protein [Pseudomonadota bacterium]
MNSRPAFVAIGLAVNLLVLARGVILMLALDYAGLGLVALVQGVILFSGLMHFGLLNGGYRLLCSAGERTKQRIIDLAYTGFGLIAAMIALGTAAFMIMSGSLYGDIAALAAIGGIATLLRSWMMNEMVAAGRFGSANLINGISMAASLGVLAMLLPGWSDTAKADGAGVAVLSIVIQPMLFAALALLSGAVMRPKAIRFSKRLAKVVFGAGFILFLTGIAIQAMSLLERAYVSAELGLEPLGRLYLAFLFLTLFQMVPNLVQQVFLPAIVAHWKARNAQGVAREMRQFFGLTLAYCAAAALALWLLAEPFLALFLPAYAGDLHWVYLLTPGLIAFAVSAPFALSFNVVIQYRWYLIAYGIGVAASVLILGTAWVLGTPLSLDAVVVVRSAIYAGMAGLLVLGWWQLSRAHSEFRFLGWR